MSVAAIFPERVLCAADGPSRCGGARIRIVDGPRRIDPVSGAIVDNNVDGLDLARALSRPLSAGQARRAAPLVRRLADAPAAAAQTTETLPLSMVWASWCAALVARGVTSIAVLPRVLEGIDGLRASADEAGIAVGPLLARSSRPILFLDDSELVISPSWRVVADAGPGTLLATGLAADVVAVIIEAAGVDGAEVWNKGFDDVGRLWFTQRIERALRSASSTDTLRLHVETVLPPLSASTSRLAALSSLADAPPKALALATTLRERQQLQRQILGRIVVELRVPSSRPQWWSLKLQDFELPEGAVELVASAGGATTEVLSALEARGLVVAEPSPSWLHAVDDADDRAAALPTSSLPPPPAPPRAVGGVRATDGDFALDHVVDAIAPVVGVQAAPRPTPAIVDDGRTVILAGGARHVRVCVDGDAVSSSSFTVSPLARPALEGAQQVRLPQRVRFGSVVVVSWDADVDIVSAGGDA